MPDTGNLTELDQQALDVFRDCIDEMHDELGTSDLEHVLMGKKDDLKSRDLGSKPETFVQRELIWPLLNVMGLDYTEEPYGGGDGDTSITDFDVATADDD